MDAKSMAFSSNMLFSATDFMHFINAKKGMQTFSPTNWRGSKKHCTVWMAVSSYIDFVSQMWEQYLNLQHFPENVHEILC